MESNQGKNMKNQVMHWAKCDGCKRTTSQYEYNKNKGFCNRCNDIYKS